MAKHRVVLVLTKIYDVEQAPTPSRQTPGHQTKSPSNFKNFTWQKKKESMKYTRCDI